MTQRTIPIQEIVVVVLKEAQRRILTLAALFSALALVALVAGLNWPKRYSASAAILVEPKSSIAPVPGSGEAASASLVTQLVLSKRVLRELLTFGGWGEQTDPRVEERMLTRMREHINISNPVASTNGPTLVRITYTDSEPERTLAIENKLTEIYIRESINSEERITRDRFQFIDGQVHEYASALTRVHEQVLAYYRAHEAAPARADEASRPTARRTRPSTEELTAPLRAEEATLTAELARQRPSAPDELVQAETRYRERALQLQAELDRLLTTLTDDHPDVRRVRAELAKAKENAARAKAEREAADRTAGAFDADIKRAARQRLEEVQRKIAAAAGERPEPTPAAAVPRTAGNPPDPEMALVRRDANMTELLNSYEATREIYQELLKRREQQRVALELAEQHGLRLQIQEPPELPAIPISTRLLYIVAAGLFLAAVLPLGLVVALVMLDGRVRNMAQLQAASKVPVLARILYTPDVDERRRHRLHAWLAAAMVVCVFVVYAMAIYRRMSV